MSFEQEFFKKLKRNRVSANQKVIDILSDCKTFAQVEKNLKGIPQEEVARTINFLISNKEARRASKINVNLFITLARQLHIPYRGLY